MDTIEKAIDQLIEANPVGVMRDVQSAIRQANLAGSMRAARAAFERLLELVGNIEKIRDETVDEETKKKWIYLLGVADRHLDFMKRKWGTALVGESKKLAEGERPPPGSRRGRLTNVVISSDNLVKLAEGWYTRETLVDIVRDMEK